MTYHQCQGGPLDGHYLWLSDDNTAFFTIHGQTGRYVEGVWHAK